MNKFYVTKEIAEKLRVKGYYREYDVTDEWVEGLFYQVEDGTFHLPRIDEVLAWLREEKALFVEVSVNNYDGFDFYFTICEKGEECWIVCGFNEEWYDTYERAALAGIECVIDNLI
jgi:hypothetical protein